MDSRGYSPDSKVEKEPLWKLRCCILCSPGLLNPDASSIHLAVHSSRSTLRGTLCSCTVLFLRCFDVPPVPVSSRKLLISEFAAKQRPCQRFLRVFTHWRIERAVDPSALFHSVVLHRERDTVRRRKDRRRVVGIKMSLREKKNS